MDQAGTRERDEATFWEAVAATRWGRYVSQLEEAAILRAHRLARAPTHALEVGCEGGRWAKLLADLGWQLTCTEVEERTLRICQQRLPAANCVLVRPEDRQLPCATESMGLILCMEVERVMHADWFQDEVCRVLQAKGLIAGIMQNRRSWRGLAQRAKNRIAGDDGWYSVAYPDWRSRFRARGFTFVHERGFYWLPFRRSSDSVLVPVCTRLERSLGLQRLPDISPWIVFVARKDR
jgi:SAM-dependent methyltransferase